MWHLGTWFSGGFGSVTLVVGLGDLKGLFQPKCLYDLFGVRSFSAGSITSGSW